MIIKEIPSTWIQREGLRLDVGPYKTGAIEAKYKLESLTVAKDSVVEVTLNGIKGIIHAGRLKRIWVNDPNHGYPFLTTTNIHISNLEKISYIASSIVAGKRNLLVKKDWILITRSGTIGRLAFCRPDMDDFACTEDVMRVVADESKIDAGYLYAFLSSTFGVQQIIAGTYGAIIQHIEPEHVKDIPVPRFAKDLEVNIGSKVKSSAQKRADANSLMVSAGKQINEHFSFPNKLALSHRIFTHSAASSSLVQKRMDATYHDQIAQLSDELIEKAGAENSLAELGIQALEGNRMKQIFTGEDYGVPFFTSGEIFRADVTPERFLLRKSLKGDEVWQTREEDLLIARSGQVGGIIGTGVWADSRFDGACVSPHVLKLRVTNLSVDAGYLYAFLCCTDVGYRQLIRGAAGSSVPFLSINDILAIKLPRMSADEEARIGEMVRQAGRLAAEAQQLEKEAVKMVEDAIEAAAPKH
ncbi:restriction endonuclease subunit S [Salmonella enterica subsp. enterica serovar Agona]|uniref:methylation-associated defense system restriction endonuclease subunit S MAD5 n=1 Tax=Vibrio cholerae TaxID=666 RepID=UPI000C7F1AA7|nr:restriction endonuclease subunit S [Vibrio cholerae]EBU9582237.1 restriction endonuclease subunit S [Salmonella enterica subsp. enterica serovar Typhimurium]EGS2940927.1 restriction endonuclease subunit S [Salmonella enterica subsp. enterica serovar Agona]PKQ53265.1 restriction endonuclease subunit S [Vibrio cholerae]